MIDETLAVILTVGPLLILAVIGLTFWVADWLAKQIAGGGGVSKSHIRIVGGMVVDSRPISQIVTEMPAPPRMPAPLKPKRRNCADLPHR